MTPSPMRRLNSYDIKSFLIYSVIIAVSMAIPYLPDLQVFLVSKGLSLPLVGYIISVLGVLAKKVVSGKIPATA